jgi:hypothetical protein
MQQQNKAQPPIIVTDNLVPGTFMAVDSVKRDTHGNVRVVGHPTAGSDVRKVVVTVDEGRAKELGLVA